MRPALMFILLLCLATPGGGQAKEPLPMLVNAAWLEQNLDEPDMILLHVAFNRREYQREHIPGARFLWFSWLSPSTPEGSTEIASPADAKRVLDELGVTPRSKIIVYFTGSSIATTTRTLVALLYFGFEGRVALLDGGLEAWKRAGGAVTSTVPSVAPSSLKLMTDSRWLTTASEVRDAIETGSATIVDARAKNFYDGTAGTIRPGHIRGAVSLPYTSLLDSINQFKSETELQRLFQTAGITPGSTILTYCHVGQQATVVLVAARLLGFNVRLYDGSYEEWSMLDETSHPVEAAPPPPTK